MRWRWIWATAVKVTYVGSCTVWHNKETGRRPGTTQEARLSEIAWSFHEWMRLMDTGDNWSSRFGVRR